jgi:replicative DNA helicase
MANLFPNKVYRVPHDKYKDANEFLQSGQAGAFKNAWYGAKKFVPENILNTSDQFLSLYRDTPEHQYVPTGIQALDDKIMGLMQGHFTVIKAPTGVGKTEVMRYLEYNLLQQKVPFATWHLEETKLRSLLGLVSYHMGGNVTRRDLIDDDTAPLVEEAIVDLTKDENFYQFYLPDGQGADELIEQIRFFREACGCKYIFFEPIQDVVAGLTEDGKEQILADLSVRLSKLAAELNVGIVTIAHTNDNGDPKYCKMIAQRASVIINLHRDKEAESEDDRNTTYLSVEKNRPCAEVGPSGRLRFNAKTFILKELA